MIKFFRRIRQKLLSENKFSKYLLYAIGEIALIMVGIFMALQLQNWNEKRKQEAQFKASLEQLYTTIKYDSEAFFRHAMNFESNVNTIDRLLKSPDSMPDTNLPYVLYSLTYDPDALSSESIYYANNLYYDPENQEQKELAKEILNYTNRIDDLDYKVDNGLKQFLQTNNIAPPKVHFNDGENGWDYTDQNYYSEEDIKTLRELLDSKTFKTVIQSVRTVKIFNHHDAKNGHSDGLSIRELIKDYYPDVKVIYKDVGIIGTSIDGFDDVGAKSTPMKLTDAERNLWEITMYLKVGKVKFRCRDSWAQNWGWRGDSEFPEGNAVHDGRDINIPEAGNYRITLDLTDNNYEFIKLDD